MKNKEIKVINGYVPFNAQLLQKSERDYKKHLGYLVTQGVFEEYPSYIPGERSKSYRLAEKYLDGQLKEITLTDKKLIQKLSKGQKIDFRSRIKYEHLFQWLNRNVTVDVANAFEYCYKEAIETKHLDYYEAYSDAYSRMMKLKYLQNGYFWFTVDKKGKRLHTNFTNLDSVLKPFITYAGQELVSIDIKNSQPFISVKVLRDFYQSNPNTTPSIPTNTIMLVKEAETFVPIDVQLYTNLVVSGQFYEFMLSKFKEKFGDAYFMRPWVYDFDKRRCVPNNHIAPRRQVKTAMFCIFFSRNEWVVKEKKLFSELFPNVMFAFEKIKEHDHSALACKLQRIESKIVLDGACKEVSLNRPELPLFTIHDSIVTTAGNEDYVEEVLKKHFQKEIGYTPQVEPEYWQRGEMKMAA